MKKSLIISVCISLLMAGQAFAGDIRLLTNSQSAFKRASKELGMAFAFKNNAPPHSLGITGFDAGIELSAAEMKDDSTELDTPSYILLPKLRVRKGLPFGVDLGVMYSNEGNTDAQLYGVEVGAEILEGSAASPAIGVRATYTKLAGIPNLDLQTVGLDASIGKGFLFLTPYAGAGVVWIDTKPVTVAALKDESLWQPRFFAGLEVKPFPLLRVVGEVEYAVRPIYSLKAAVGF